jgi:hypothetical protein
MVADVAERVVSAARREGDAYRDGVERPLGGYVASMSVYGATVGVLGLVVRRRGAPRSIPWSDVALVSLATHKLARLITKDSVTSPLRAPFTRFEGPAGEGELKEEVRGQGARKAFGELITCPFCIGQWVATGFVFGLALAPRATRMAATIFTALAASDFLQIAYAGAVKALQDGGESS